MLKRFKVLLSKIVISFLLGISPAWAGSKTHIVLISNMKFEPSALSVQAGDTVIWKNEDLVPHTATAKGVFDSGTIDASGSYKIVVKKKGNFDYVCSFHPTMKAAIKVQ